MNILLVELQNQAKKITNRVTVIKRDKQSVQLGEMASVAAGVHGTLRVPGFRC